MLAFGLVVYFLSVDAVTSVLHLINPIIECIIMYVRLV